MIQVILWWCLPFCAKIRTLNSNRWQNIKHPLFFEVHLYHVILFKCLSFKVLVLKWQMLEAPRKACSSAALHLESFDITCSVKGQAHGKHFWLPSQEMYLWTICSSEVKEKAKSLPEEILFDSTPLLCFSSKEKNPSWTQESGQPQTRSTSIRFLCASSSVQTKMITRKVCLFLLIAKCLHGSVQWVPFL